MSMLPVHSGWNACSSCYGEKGASRSMLVLPGLKVSTSECSVALPVHSCNSSDLGCQFFHSNLMFNCQAVTGCRGLLAASADQSQKRLSSKHCTAWFYIHWAGSHTTHSRVEGCME